jgi:hypothetical protein
VGSGSSSSSDGSAVRMGVVSSLSASSGAVFVISGGSTSGVSVGVSSALCVRGGMSLPCGAVGSVFVSGGSAVSGVGGDPSVSTGDSASGVSGAVLISSSSSGDISIVQGSNTGSSIASDLLVKGSSVGSARAGTYVTINETFSMQAPEPQLWWIPGPLSVRRAEPSYIRVAPAKVLAAARPLPRSALRARPTTWKRRAV